MPTSPASLANVLLVEDNSDDELLTLRALRSVPECHVHVLRDGSEAVEYLRNRSISPRLVLLDLKLPRLSGLEVLDLIRRLPDGEQIPVVVLSSSKEKNDVYESYRLGANSFIQKPIEFEQFVETVRLVGHYWVSTNVAAEE